MRRRPDTPVPKFTAAAAIAAALWLCASMFSGCAKPLLSPEEPRSPFDRYDTVRAQHAAQSAEDKFGRKTPNLRARLEPKD